MTDTTLPTAIMIPDDAAPSRLRRAKAESPDDFARAGDRIYAFHRKYKEGRIHTVIDGVRETGDGVLIYTVSAAAYKDADTATPDATAHATRATNDPDKITAQFPQETAETAAVSRALRNLGILPKRSS